MEIFNELDIVPNVHSGFLTIYNSFRENLISKLEN